MKSNRIFGVLACWVLFGAGVSLAAESQNEVGAFLVFPDVSADSVPAGGQVVETIFSVTNASTGSYQIHVAYYGGDPSTPSYCDKCDFLWPLGSSATASFVVKAFPTGNTEIQALNTTASFFCSWTRGFITVSLEDLLGNTVSDNVIFGNQTVTNYTTGQSYSSGAIPFPAKGPNDGDRVYEFDNIEYGKMPRIVAADFIAPNQDGSILGEFDAYLTLFTLGFEDAVPPVTDCSVTGYDASSNPFSRSFQFGCWTRIQLEDIALEFTYPNLGLTAIDEHGWLQLNCNVDGAAGGVHGALFQVEPTGTIWGGAGATSNATAWSRTLAQSVTTGDSMMLDADPFALPPAASATGKHGEASLVKPDLLAPAKPGQHSPIDTGQPAPVKTERAPAGQVPPTGLEKAGGAR